MKTPSLTKFKSKFATIRDASHVEAPGLKSRDNAILQKALGLKDNAEISPIKLGALAQYHPDPKVKKAAKSALSKLEFNLNPTKIR